MGSGLRLESRPWPHLRLNAVLTADELERLSHWPVDGWQWLKHSDIVRPDGTSLRKWQRLDARFPAIARRLELMEATLREVLSVDAGDLYPHSILVEDLPGYRIRTHTDCDDKVITCQIYLAEDDEHQHQGAVLKGNGDVQMPYLMNQGYAFKVDKNTWHRVNRSETGRRSIQVTFYSKPR